MRLWHIDLIPYLPKSQLIAQWRELNSIFKKQDRHILINYVYTYPTQYLYIYTQQVLSEFVKRNYKVKSFDNLLNYFKYYLESQQYKNLNNKLVFQGWEKVKNEHTFDEHDNEYLTICYYNLKEKYLRGQKDFTADVWDKLNNFYKEKMEVLEK